MSTSTSHAGATSRRRSVGERVPATLGPYVEVWLARQATRVKPRTQETYSSVIRIHILSHFGEATPLASITRAQVRDFLLGKLAEGYGGDSGAAATSARRDAEVLAGSGPQSIPCLLAGV